jgi:solute carrier family 45, member 1/2/4
MVGGDVLRYVTTTFSIDYVEITFNDTGTPYLLTLGLTKSAVAMVFLAGPISGLVVQPLIGMQLSCSHRTYFHNLCLGVLADKSKSRFGRRRPYMLVGVLICTTAMLLLGFTRPFATIFTSLGSPSVRHALLVMAVLVLSHRMLRMTH